MIRSPLCLPCLFLCLACAKSPGEGEAPTIVERPIEERAPDEAGQPDEEAGQPDEAEPPDEAGQPEAKVVDSDELALSPLRGKSFVVAPGTAITWSYESHGSVGKGGSCSSSNQGVVRYVREDVEYDNPERLKAGMSGADGGTAKVVFEALAAGSAELACEVEYRGSVERTDIFSITVEG